MRIPLTPAQVDFLMLLETEKRAASDRLDAALAMVLRSQGVCGATAVEIDREDGSLLVREEAP